MTTLLGQNTHYPEQYAPDILEAIPRAAGRAVLNVNAWYGGDYWHLYELSWLNAQGLPQIAVGRLFYSANSPYIVESKSLKLYLNSLNFMVFDDSSALIATITKDVGQCVHSAVQLELLPVTTFSAHTDFTQWQCIDQTQPTFSSDLLSTSLRAGTVQPSVLRTHTHTNAHERLVSHLFRSKCPVTAQPDWASIFIEYTGNQIEHASLIEYLVSYRNHQGFHEQCIEQIFTDLVRYCQLTVLSVYGAFSRRGGIDIHPYRTTSDHYTLSPMHLVRC